MFVSKSRFNCTVVGLERDIKRLDARYWELWHKHETLLTSLGLVVRTTPAKTEYVKKGGPEVER